MRKKIIAAIACLMLTLPAIAQETVSFPLEKHSDGHYYFQADVCGKGAQIMLESGIPALLIGRDFYDSNMKDCGLEFRPSESRMRLMNGSYRISFRADGRVGVGGAVYDGPVFILEGFDGISLPVQHLKDRKTGRRIVTVDLERLSMSVGGTVPVKGSKYRMTLDRETGRPFVSSYFYIDGQAFDGKLIVDLGNPMLLFLFSQHRCLKNAVAKGAIELHDAYDRNGRLVAQGISAGSVKLFGKEYGNVSVGVTDVYRNAREVGFLGTPFFDTPVVMDFDKGWLYK